MQLIQTWPEELRATHDGLMTEGGQRLRDGDFIGAAEVFDAAFRLVVDAQPEGRRYHKGESLHNKGLALVFAGRGDEAVRETLAAFVEDAASLAEENPRFEELARPAAHNLVYVFGLAGPALAQFARQVRMSITSGDPLADPHSRLGTAVAIEAGQAPPSGAGRTRTIGRLNSQPDRRVFIGGSYSRLDEAMRPLRDHLVSIGWDGVIAADFGTPLGWGEDEVAVALLRICHYAVFEVSESAGQVEEVAAVPETMRTPERLLAVFDSASTSKPGISAGMTMVKLGRWGVQPVGYPDVETLQRVAENWLKP